MADAFSNTWIEALPDLSLVVRRDGRIIANLGGCELGISSLSGGLVGKSLQDVWPADIASYLHNLVRRTLKARTAGIGRYRYKGACYEVRVKPKGVERAIVVLRCLSAVAVEYAELTAAEPEHSQPSACQTREAFAQRLSAMADSSRLREIPFALIAIHLGGLREAEALLGTAATERLLATAVQRLRRSIQITPARLESDLLAVLIERTPDRSTATAAAERIRSALAESIECEGRTFLLSPILGVARFPEDGSEPPVLLNSARAAITAARRLGRQNVVAFSSAAPPVMPGASLADLEQELRWAFAREQFSLHYQPVVELAGRRTIALHAALRWMHPVKGPIGATAFLPLAETTDLGARIQAWALRRACLDLKQLSEHGYLRPRIVFTLGRPFAGAEHLVDDMARAAVETGGDVSRLDIGIPEQVLAASTDLGELQLLRKRGIRIFAEDFGTGGLSLHHLEAVPIDGLRLHSSLISGVERDARAQAACDSAIAIAKAFGLICVATGVTTAEQMEYLRSHGCDAAQGELISAPQPLQQLLHVEQNAVSQWPGI